MEYPRISCQFDFDKGSASVVLPPCYLYDGNRYTWKDVLFWNGFHYVPQCMQYRDYNGIWVQHDVARITAKCNIDAHDAQWAQNILMINISLIY